MSKPGRSVSRPPSTKLEVSGKPVSSPVFQDNFPTLWDFLARQRDYGEIHRTGCITIFVDGSKLKAVVNDRPARQSAFVSADGLLQLMARIDRGLIEGSLNFTKQGYQRRPRAKVNT